MADEHLLDIELAKEVPVRSAYASEELVPHAIALRKRNPQLKAGPGCVCQTNL